MKYDGRNYRKSNSIVTIPSEAGNAGQPIAFAKLSPLQFGNGVASHKRCVNKKDSYLTKKGYEVTEAITRKESKSKVYVKPLTKVEFTATNAGVLTIKKRDGRIKRKFFLAKDGQVFTSTELTSPKEA